MVDTGVFCIDVFLFGFSPENQSKSFLYTQAIDEVVACWHCRRTAGPRNLVHVTILVMY